MRLAIAALALLGACTTPDPSDPRREDGDPGDGTFVPTGVPPASPHLALGAPVDGTPDDDTLIAHEEFQLGYSRFLNAPSWVSWRTRRGDYGPVDRFSGDFSADDRLPTDYYHPVHDDLTNSGFDRGHMVRSEERTRTADSNRATFVMSNVLAQRADLNRGPWYDFERYVQREVGEGRDAYMLAGPIWSAACATHAPRVPGDGCRDHGRSEDPQRRIAIPEATWKIVVFVRAGVALDAPSSDAYVIAVRMPNIEGIRRDDWYEYRVKVSALEAETGYDFVTLE
ncbi:MAG: DNA/RNA non-specific endonuclease [Deltaproteobacteria bacterium]|nr:DNA/RNA non-specific endonuclease [Deltaproteobacteria bacterium]MCW5801072.1 DNA/RNA non-specific endonuclease [Deltaproteobacteria bacterium]